MMDRFAILLGKAVYNSVDQRIMDAYYSATDVIANAAGVNIIDWLNSWDDPEANAGAGYLWSESKNEVNYVP